MTKDDIKRLFDEAGEAAGWRPGIGNDLVLGFLAHFYAKAVEDFQRRSGQYLTNDATREAAIHASVAAERRRVLAAVERRLLTWRQRTMNKSGDRLALDDFMSADTIADLADYVCDEWA